MFCADDNGRIFLIEYFISELACSNCEKRVKLRSNQQVYSHVAKELSRTGTSRMTSPEVPPVYSVDRDLENWV